MIVAKFGGSSLADAAQFVKVKDIVRANNERKYIVPSAPGKRGAGDDKITDLLYACFDAANNGKSFRHVLERIQARYVEIAEELGIEMDFSPEFAAIEQALKNGASREYAASRGEYLNGKLLAKYLDFPFVDAAEVIRFTRDGRLMEEETNALIASRLKGLPRAVIPGFYGAEEDGTVRTFSRGGSDVSGALVARAVNADIYENWTDVTGFRMADPRIVPDAQYIATITYRELRELSYMGATVLHEEAVFPVRKAGIPTNIRNTNDPKHPGTMIRANAGQDETMHTITGIAGHKGFSIVSVEKDMMNAELGFGRRVLQAFEEYGVSFEHLPTGIDTMCVVVHEKELKPHQEEVIRRICELVNPDQVTVHDHLALIATVGRGMVRNFGTAARLFTAISSQGISIRTIDQGSSELNIIVGVDEDDFENAVKAIYDTFVRI
ncbi:MAG: aspartate kinase [Clostridiales bacterium]|nr:aspartate kinase [Clostridiales bacterium]